MAGDRAKLRWRANIWRALAWLKAPSDEENHASFQLDVMWLDGPERLPETYVLERSNQHFNVICEQLRDASIRRLSVKVYPMEPGPFGTVRPDGTVLVRDVSVRTPPRASQVRQADYAW